MRELQRIFDEVRDWRLLGRRSPAPAVLSEGARIPKSALGLLDDVMQCTDGPGLERCLSMVAKWYGLAWNPVQLRLPGFEDLA